VEFGIWPAGREAGVRMELESGDMDGMKGNVMLPRMDIQKRSRRMRRERWRRLDWT
jgi:hypothetical protein